MPNARMRIAGSLFLLAGLLVVPLAVQAQELPGGRALIEDLRQGGYNLYFRHEATDWSQHDRVRQRDDWLSCDGTRMRQLSESGRERARWTGNAMRQLGIPIGEVLASPYCRSMETARLLGLGEVRASTEVVNLRAADYFGGRAAVIATARALLARPPATGSNRVIVAHGNVAREATPVYPDEGEMVIFAPDGEGGFRLVGSIPAGHWKDLGAGP